MEDILRYILSDAYGLTHIPSSHMFYRTQERCIVVVSDDVIAMFSLPGPVGIVDV